MVTSLRRRAHETIARNQDILLKQCPKLKKKEESKKGVGILAIVNASLAHSKFAYMVHDANGHLV